MYCGNCGSELDSSVNFCSVCGYRQNNISNKSVNDESENKEKNKKSVTVPIIIGVLLLMVIILSVTVFKPQNRFRRYLENEYDFVCLTDYCEYTSQTKDDEGVSTGFSRFIFDDHVFEGEGVYYNKEEGTKTSIVGRYNWDNDEVVVQGYLNYYFVRDKNAKPDYLFVLDKYNNFECVYGLICMFPWEWEDDEEIALTVKERANELVDEFGISFEDLEW